VYTMEHMNESLSDNNVMLLSDIVIVCFKPNHAMLIYQRFRI
jgi:hypothetical protein